MTYIKKQANKQGGGWREGSADEGACCHAQKPEFDPRIHIVEDENYFRQLVL